jgi:hypothetical protein
MIEALGTVSFSVNLSHRDVYRAIFLFHSVKSIRLIVLSLWLGFGWALLPSLMDFGFEIWQIFTGVGLAVFFWLLFAWRIARLSIQRGRTSGLVKYSFDLKSIGFEAETSGGHFDWSLVAAAYESDDYIFVKLRPPALLIIPKSQITDVLPELKALLVRQLGNKVRLRT